MQSLAENNLIRFVNITKKKDGIFANYKVKGVRGGMAFSASIAVDILAAGVDPAEDPLEKIIEVCADVAVREFRQTDLQFEGLAAVAAA